ncbi:helix-turn-helix domain-containing protein [Spirosoma koreense]
MSEEYKELSKEQSQSVCRNLSKLATDLRIKQEAIAEKTGYKQANISRLFSGRYSPRLEIIFTVLNAINELSGKNYTLKDIDLSTDNSIR